MKTTLVVVELVGRACSLKASTSTVLSIVFCHPPQMRPEPKPVWWQLHVHLEDSSLLCLHKAENSTFCLSDVFILSENCPQLLVVKKPMPNQNLRLKPLENKLSWGLYLFWWVTDEFLSTSDFRDLDHNLSNCQRCPETREVDSEPLETFVLDSPEQSQKQFCLCQFPVEGGGECMASGVRPLCNLPNSFQVVSVGIWVYFLIYNMGVISPLL